MSIKVEDCALEVVEPLGTLLRRTTDNPQVQVFELGFRVLRNASCAKTPPNWSYAASR